MLTMRIIAGFALLAGTACTAKSPLDEMQPGERGRVVRVIDGDALALDTGQSVRLVGVEAPSRNGRYEDADPYAEEAARELEDLAMGRGVRLHYPGLTRDRYNRALAHLTTADNSGPDWWVNLELVQRGAVRVRLYPDTDLGGEALLAAEAEARTAAKGLWALRAYIPRPAERLGEDFRGFAIVEIELGGAAVSPDEETRTILCSRATANAGLVIDMTFNARPSCEAPSGKTYLVRGWVSGGRLELDHPLHLQPLESD